MNKEMVKEKDNHVAELNALLKKSDGDVANLSSEELQALQRLCSLEMERELCAEYAQFYPNENPLVAVLKDEVYRKRTDQPSIAKALGMSIYHYNKIIHGHNAIGLDVAKRIHRNLGLDGNFILKYV
jgi:hypothetical protein